MTRQQKYPDTKTFHFYNANPKEKYTGDCTVRAVSTVLGKTWEDVTMDMAKLACETGYAVNSTENTDMYLEKHGFKKQKQPRKKNKKKYTGKEFCKVQQRWLDDEANHGNEWDDGIIISPKIIAHVGGHHIVAIMDGKVNDIWDSTDGCIGNYWTKGVSV